MESLKRRDFLKIIAAVPTGLMLSKILTKLDGVSLAVPNVIVVVMDALTARNMSLYGYKRKTTPNIERFASRSNVYHAHHSAGTFTTPGAASLLTGTYPWTHRAINLKGLIARDQVPKNVFHLFDSRYKRIAFSQNSYAHIILGQLGKYIDMLLPIGAFSEQNHYLTKVHTKDLPSKFESYENFLYSLDPNTTPGSLLLGTLNKFVKQRIYKKTIADNLQYSRNRLIFDIDKVFDGISSQAENFYSPSFLYFHLFPPHEPYSPQKKFRGLFKDGWQPSQKPKHPLQSNISQERLDYERLKYDQYIATIDAAFGTFLDQLEKIGALDNSYVILTSDHGESFERGYWGHSGPLVYESGTQIPLLISAPGQSIRRDFYLVTSSVDLLPTLLWVSNLAIPDWCEGSILPGFGVKIDPMRITYSMDAKGGSAFDNLSPITIAMYQGNYKLIYYKGYGSTGFPYYGGLFELYNIKNDPEELHDLINVEQAIAHQMQEHLLNAYKIANQPQ